MDRSVARTLAWPCGGLSVPDVLGVFGGRRTCSVRSVTAQAGRDELASQVLGVGEGAGAGLAVALGLLPVAVGLQF